MPNSPELGFRTIAFEIRRIQAAVRDLAKVGVASSRSRFPLRIQTVAQRRSVRLTIWQIVGKAVRSEGVTRPRLIDSLMLGGNVLCFRQLVILSPCLLGLAPFWRIRTGQSAISKVSRTAAAPHFFARRRPSISITLRENSMTKLYVGNLPFTATEEAVRNLFAPHGTVEKLSLINDRDT
ncbi:MAG: hypothetical protein ACREUG_16375, partial [Steroidobacteraceae bacterium]